ncbi:type VI secretion system tip protein VgrG [Salmonella enterica]|nr:type VI secretion system tip protein VgrG [Salmonella enterica]ECI4153132.1 type VI secretion system tip protein VgrG [Salmonella enterica subsp. salamae]HCM1853064.1 type VI secretion system tip protein VgrG [Salmonella enterica subsp. salamae serovar 42:z29:-]EAU0241700.1 type VI secretion system tip protein VgrG [Salmonella enterica]EAX3604104.1 type VI secretion system tip protein VgrG [Salmonella enterica]
MSLSGLRFTLEVDGLPPDTFAVTEFHLSQSLSSLFSLALTLASAQPSLSFEQVLEKTAHLTVWQGMVPQRRVKGVVTCLELGEYDGHQMLYAMKVRPPFWRAALRKNFRIFQNQDIKTIVTTLLKENDVKEWSPLLGDPHPAREFCVQYGETDFDFLSRLLAEEGIFSYEEHGLKSTNQSLVLCDNVAFLPAPTDIAFNPDTRSGTVSDFINRFRLSAQIRPSSMLTKDYTFKRPGWSGRFEHPGEKLDWQRSQYEVYDWPGRFKDEQHGKAFARYQMEGWRNNAEVAECRSPSPKLWPGIRFRLTGHPQQMLNREWQVVGSELHGKQPQARSGSRGKGTELENKFQVIPGDRTWRPVPHDKPSVDGPQSATVTGPAGEEIFCDEYGRVRVQFNWDRYNPADESSSCWIRVVQAWAGTGFGNLAIPRVGQEVIVDFLNGDPDQPIIMGRTYREDNKPQGGLPGTKTQMSIRSKTYKGGGFNELRFEDATGNEQMYLHAQKNMDTEVLNNRTTDVKVNHTETVGGRQDIAVTGEQTVTVKQMQTIKVHTSRDDAVKINQGAFTGGEKMEQVMGKWRMASDTSIRLACGEAAIELDKSGLITFIGNSFNMTFTDSGQINTKGGKLDLNMEGGGTNMTKDPELAAMSIEAHFPPEKKK